MDNFLVSRNSIADCISSIVERNDKILRFWHNGADGWAPTCTTDLLKSARLDRQVELSRTLRLWAEIPVADSDAYLILAWANLGSLVEGSLKWFLSVYVQAYEQLPILSRCGDDLAPDELYLVRLCDYFDKHVWCDFERSRWTAYVNCVRRRRNAIHSFRDVEVGTHDEFVRAVRDYADLLELLDGRVPYPDCSADTFFRHADY